MKTDIPARTEYKCGLCECATDDPRGRRATLSLRRAALSLRRSALSLRRSALSLRRSALDYRSEPVADASIDRDFCPPCADKIVAAINAVPKP